MNSSSHDSRPAPKPGRFPRTPPVFREASLQPVYLALDAAGIGAWEWNVDENVITWSRSVQEIFELPAGPAGQSWTELFNRIPKEDIDKASAMLVRLLVEQTSGERFEIQVRIERPDGGTRWIEIAGSFVGCPGSLRLLGTLRDITGRQRTDDEARFYRALLECEHEASRDGILVVSSDQRILHYNRRFVEIWGVPASILASRDESEVSKWLRQAVASSDASADQGQPFRAEPGPSGHCELHLRDGRVVERYSAPVAAPDRKYLGRVWYYRDITEQQKLKTAPQAERPDILGGFASGIAHDLNNILTPIVLHTQLIGETLSTTHEARPSLQEVMKNCEKATTLIRQILALSDRQGTGAE